MSLNKLTDINEEHKWMNINCNSLKVNGISVNGGVIGEYTPLITSVNLGMTTSSELPVIFEIKSNGVQKYLTLSFSGFDINLTQASTSAILTFRLPTGYQSPTPALDQASIVGQAINPVNSESFLPISSNYQNDRTSLSIVLRREVATTGSFTARFVISVPVISI